MDMKDILVPNLPGPSLDYLLELELLIWGCSAYPICRPGRPSPCSMDLAMAEWLLDVDIMGWHDWDWLRQYDIYIDPGEFHMHNYNIDQDLLMRLPQRVCGARQWTSMSHLWHQAHVAR